MSACIYGLTDPRTEKVRYVGWTVDLLRRVAHHARTLMKARRSAPEFQERINAAKRERPQVPWNRGLSVHTDERVARGCETRRQRHGF